MFQPIRRTTNFGSAIRIAELTFHATVRSLRRNHGNAVIGLFMNILQSLIFVMMFYVMYLIFGVRSAAIRGDFLLFLMSGVFLFMTHTKTVGAIMSAEGSTSAMMQHGPMNTAIALLSSALASLYIQVLSVLIILFLYHVLFTPITIDDPVGAGAMFLLAWATGGAVGLVLYAIKPWFPTFATLATTFYRRANMIASGKMFVANTLPFTMLKLFDWNPLFHCIDQGRGYIFINYNPHYSSISYPLYVGLTLAMIGLMGEFFTRQHASASWDARR